MYLYSAGHEFILINSTLIYYLMNHSSLPCLISYFNNEIPSFHHRLLPNLLNPFTYLFSSSIIVVSELFARTLVGSSFIT